MMNDIGKMRDEEDPIGFSDTTSSESSEHVPNKKTLRRSMVAGSVIALFCGVLLAILAVAGVFDGPSLSGGGNMVASTSSTLSAALVDNVPETTHESTTRRNSYSNSNSNSNDEDNGIAARIDIEKEGMYDSYHLPESDKKLYRIKVGDLEDEFKVKPTSGCGVFSRAADENSSTSDWAVLRAQKEDADHSDFFGSSIAQSNGFIVVGAFRDEHDNGNMGGTAYVFGRDNKASNSWIELQKLVPSDGSLGHMFGASVAIDNDSGVLVVGAPGDNFGNDLDKIKRSGSVYVFEKDDNDTWIETAKLHPHKPSDLLEFGSAVAVAGNTNTIAVGATGDRENGKGSGAVYVFQRHNKNGPAAQGLNGQWFEQAKLTASDASAGDYFGNSIAMSTGSIVVGSHLDGDNGEKSGSAYVFSQNNDGLWIQEAKILPDDGSGGDDFGVSVDISKDGSKLVVGASLDDHGDGYDDRDAGSVYVFEKDADSTKWEQTAKLVPEDLGHKDYFGFAVSIDGENIAVGAIYDDDEGYNGGSAYLFHYDGSDWTQSHKILPKGVSAGDVFGYGVSIEENMIVVSSHGDDHFGSGSGAAYAIELC